jgi:hypothetical protein
MNYKVSNSPKPKSNHKQKQIYYRKRPFIIEAAELKNVPVELLLFAAESPFYILRAISVFIILKNETTTGVIHNYTKQVQAISSKYGITTATLNKFIPVLLNIDWARANGSNLHLVSYKLFKAYSLNIENRCTIRYNISEDISDIILAKYGANNT